MGPPTEQLIRDYLNRLSVAARGQLGPDDRRALVNRTRDFIERKASLAGPPTPVEVARLLSGLGDPSRLVQQERQRLAAVRGELPDPGSGRGRLARALRRYPGRTRSASWHWPVQEGNRTDLQVTLLEGSEEQGATDGTATDDAVVGNSSNGAGLNGVAAAEVPANSTVAPAARATTADLTATDLTAADLTAADLTAADLTAADLTAADLTAADLTAADLTAADLTTGDVPAAGVATASAAIAGVTTAGVTAAELTTADPAPAQPAPGDTSAGHAGRASLHVPAQAREPSWFLQTFGGHPHADDLDGEAVRADEGRAADEGQAGAVPAGGGQAAGGQAPGGQPDPTPGASPATRTGGATARPSWPSTVARSGRSGHRPSSSGSVVPGSGEQAGAAQQSAATPAWQLTTPADPVVPRQVRRALRAVASWYRRNPLEAASVTLLGLGVIFPPIWVLGAALALASRFWDYIDKWVGLALPPVVTIIGVAIGVANGGHVSMGQSVHEAWVYGVAASRIASVLSGCFLGWRTVHGRRPPAVPPWNRPHNIG
jgi:hypothetical protein